MIHNKVVLINNEKISSENDGFYCDNDDVKSCLLNLKLSIS